MQTIEAGEIRTVEVYTWCMSCCFFGIVLSKVETDVYFHGVRESCRSWSPCARPEPVLEFLEAFSTVLEPSSALLLVLEPLGGAFLLGLGFKVKAKENPASNCSDLDVPGDLGAQVQAGHDISSQHP